MDISKFCQEKNCFVRVSYDLYETYSIKERNGKIEPDVVETSENVTYYLKTIKNGRIGFSKFYNLKDIGEAYKLAIKNSVKFKDVELNEIKTKPKDSFKNTVYDLKDAFERLDFDFNCDKKEVFLKYKENKTEMFDPYGNNACYKMNDLKIGALVIKDGMDYYYSINTYDQNKAVEKIRREIIFQYENTRGDIKKIDNIKGYDIIFYDDPTCEFIEIVLEGFDGKLFKENKIWSSQYFNKPLFNEKFNLIEDPKGNFIKKYYIDNDGFETTKKQLVKNGKINKMCYDFYSSVLYNETPTGNGFYTDLYGIGFTNIDINCEKYDSDKYIMVLQGLGFHTCNEITGDMNIVCSLGFVYENGNVYPIKNVPISFNWIKNANNIYGFREKKEMGWLKSPNLLFNL